MSVQYGNLGIIRDNLQLYYDVNLEKCFRGEATTNIITETNFNNWLAYGIKNVTTYVLAPDYNYAYRISDDRTNAYDGIEITSGYLSTLTGGLTYTLSVWFIVNPSATARSHFRVYTYISNTNGFLSLRLHNDTGDVSIARNDLNAGSAVSVSSYGVSETKLYNGYVWKRGYVTFVMPSGSTNNQMEFLVAHDNLNNVASTANTGYTIAWGPQLEQKSYPTPFVNGSRTNTFAGGGGLLDTSGNNNNLNLDAVSFTSSSFYFNGSSDHQTVSGLFGSGGTNTFSFDFWAKPTNASNLLNGLFHLGYTGENAWFIRMNANAFAIYKTSASTIQYVTVGTINNEEWVHISFTYNYVTNTIKTYKNGILITTNSTGNKFATILGNLDIGRLGSGSPTVYSYYSGDLAVLRFWKKTLSAAEVLQNYNAQKHLFTN